MLTLRSLSIASLLLAGALASGQAMAQSRIGTPVKSPTLQQPPAPTLSLATPTLFSVHSDHVKPMIEAWDPRDADRPIRDYSFDKLSSLPPCAVAFWTGNRDSYTVVPFKEIEVVDKSSVNSTESTQYTAYNFRVQLRCKNGGSCIYNSAEPTSRQASFSVPGVAYSRLVYKDGRKKYTGYPSPQAYWADVLKGMQAAAACQGKSAPSSYAGGRG